MVTHHDARDTATSYCTAPTTCYLILATNFLTFGFYLSTLMRLAGITLGVIAILVITILLFMQRKIFGKNPEGERLERIMKSPNYKDGSFQNVIPTEVILKNTSTLKMLKNFLNKPKLTIPPDSLPSIKNDLKHLSYEKPVIVWFGHSSYFIQYQNFKILVDPVFSANASPVSFFGKAFTGSNIFTADDFGDIDLLVITHDHYDHLDYKTIVNLDSKVKSIVVPLGVGSHLEYWDVPASKITELDWWEAHDVIKGIKIISTPARHFSGRKFTRNKTLWSSYVLKLQDHSIFLGGDSGYDRSFKDIGNKYGPFDLAILESGQYGDDWPYIHMLPEQTVQASRDLNAEYLLPVHWSKFLLANHLWDDPIKRVWVEAQKQAVNVTTPMIGEFVVLDSIYPKTQWWLKRSN